MAFTHPDLLSLSAARAYAERRASPSWVEGVNTARLDQLDAQALSWQIHALLEAHPESCGFSLVERGHADIDDALCVTQGPSVLFVPADGDSGLPEAVAALLRDYVRQQPEAFHRVCAVRHFSRHVFEDWAGRLWANPETGQAWAAACREEALSKRLSASPVTAPRVRM